MSDQGFTDEMLADAFVRVSKGNQVTLYRWGRPIARLVPADQEFDPEESLAAMRRILDMARGADPGHLRLIDLIHEGHKY